MKKISLDKLLLEYDMEYAASYQKITSLIEAGKLKPVKTSGLNGKKPALYQKYWLITEEKDYSSYIEEIQFELALQIQKDYYIRHLDCYEKEREWVLLLSDYLKNETWRFRVPMSMNERSFDIWHREKFLKEEEGKKILKHCGLTTEQLFYYDTKEPMAYYVKTRQVPQKILIIENKDTFYTMRRYLMDDAGAILGEEFGTLIYGMGKVVINSFQDFTVSGEPYMQDTGNRFLYFGDLDYEGILIYENLAQSLSGQYDVIPFTTAYEAMLGKGEKIEKLPMTASGQNRHISDRFFSYFSRETVMRMKRILESDRYIPQEILNREDFATCNTNF